MEKDEYNRMKAYYLNQAKKYEKHGFSFAALELYKSFRPATAKRIYASLGKRAERAGLFLLAAEAYQSAGMIKKSRALWRKIGFEMQKNNLPALASEAFERLKPESLMNRKAGKFASAAMKLSRKGRFHEAQKEFIKGAKYFEKQGDLKRASLFFFNGRDAKNAQSVWNKAHKRI